jgi:hypothetical protein
MPEHKLIKSDDPMTVWAWAAIITVLALIGWIGNQDRKPEFSQCPRAGEGQQLVGRGHTEADGEPGELMCIYAIDTHYDRMVAEK